MTKELIERLAEARWKADSTDENGNFLECIAPPFTGTIKKHYMKEAERAVAALTAAGLEVNKTGTREALKAITARVYCVHQHEPGGVIGYVIDRPKEEASDLFRTAAALTKEG